MPKKKNELFAAIYNDKIVTSADFRIACQRVHDNANDGYVADMNKNLVYSVSRSYRRAKLVDSETAGGVMAKAAAAIKADPLL